jgi:hypothetical protein
MSDSNNQNFERAETYSIGITSSIYIPAANSNAEIHAKT